MNRGRGDLALDATLRAAAPHQIGREKNGMALVIHDQDIREKVREKRIGNFIVFAVDASGSMGAHKRMVETKGAVLSLLLDAYVKRDKVCLVAFRGQGAEVLLPPTGSVEQAYRLLEELPTGGRTPLAHGLEQSGRIIESQLLRDRRSIPLLVLVSDGRANVSQNGGKPLEEAMELAGRFASDDRFRRVVVDVERDGFVRFGLAEKAGGRHGRRPFPHRGPQGRGPCLPCAGPGQFLSKPVAQQPHYDVPRLCNMRYEGHRPMDNGSIGLTKPSLIVIFE